MILYSSSLAGRSRGQLPEKDTMSFKTLVESLHVTLADAETVAVGARLKGLALRQPPTV